MKVHQITIRGEEKFEKKAEEGKSQGEVRVPVGKGVLAMPGGQGRRFEWVYQLRKGAMLFIAHWNVRPYHLNLCHGVKAGSMN